jgi:hypothetical protein
MLFLTREEFFKLHPDGGTFAKCMTCGILVLLPPGVPKACSPAHAYSPN